MASRSGTPLPRRVSVVIPTSGRPSLQQAIESALGQRDVEVEVLVVRDSAPLPGQDSAPATIGPGVRTIDSAERNANSKRQLGIEHAGSPLIAMLDDDDWWDPDKLSSQLDHLDAAGRRSGSLPERWVCGAGILVHRGEEVVRSPRLPPAELDDVLEYLFLRKTIRDPMHQFQSSTLLFPRSLGLEIPFRRDLPFHQDWTWLLDTAAARTSYFFDPHFLTHYMVNEASITSSTRADQSTAWAAEHLAEQSKRVRGDYHLTVPFNMAVRGRDLARAAEILRSADRHGRPGLPARTRAVLKLAQLAASEGMSGLRALRGR